MCIHSMQFLFSKDVPECFKACFDTARLQNATTAADPAKQILLNETNIAFPLHNNEHLEFRPQCHIFRFRSIAYSCETDICVDQNIAYCCEIDISMPTERIQAQCRRALVDYREGGGNVRDAKGYHNRTKAVTFMGRMGVFLCTCF